MGGAEGTRTLTVCLPQGPRLTPFAQVKRCYVGEMASAPVDALGPSARPLVFAKLAGPGPTRARVQAGPARTCATGDDASSPWSVHRRAGGSRPCWPTGTPSTDETRPFAWLTLDQADNDPASFWTYVIEALRTQHPGER